MPDRRVLIHMGLPKTGTTALQKFVFRGLPGYRGGECSLSRGKWGPSLLGLYSQFLGGQTRGLARRRWSQNLAKWADSVLQSSEPLAIYSDECLARWPVIPGDYAVWPVMGPLQGARKGVHPVVDFIGELKASLYGEVRLSTAVGLRNQTDWLGSLAAQKFIVDTSFVERLVHDDDAFLDYATLVRNLDLTVGVEENLVMIFEDGMRANVERLLDFLEVKSHKLIGSDQPPPVVNASRLDELTWSLHRPRSWEKSRFLGSCRDALERVLPQQYWRLFRRMYTNGVSDLDGPVGFGGHGLVKLTRQQRDVIRAHCYSSNSQLNARVESNIFLFGY